MPSQHGTSCRRTMAQPCCCDWMRPDVIFATEEAVADANGAIELDASVSKAYLRKGTACIKLEEYQTAKAALEAGVLLAPGDSRFIRMIKECDECIAEKANDLPKQVMHDAPPSIASPSSDITTESTKVSEPPHMIYPLKLQ